MASNCVTRHLACLTKRAAIGDQPWKQGHSNLIAAVRWILYAANLAAVPPHNLSLSQGLKHDREGIFPHSNVFGCFHLKCDSGHEWSLSPRRERVNCARPAKKRPRFPGAVAICEDAGESLRPQRPELQKLVAGDGFGGRFLGRCISIGWGDGDRLVGVGEVGRDRLGDVGDRADLHDGRLRLL